MSVEQRPRVYWNVLDWTQASVSRGRPTGTDDPASLRAQKAGPETPHGGVWRVLNAALQGRYRIERQLGEGGMAAALGDRATEFTATPHTLRKQRWA